jgi:hypothetical protein
MFNIKMIALGVAAVCVAGIAQATTTTGSIPLTMTITPMCKIGSTTGITVPAAAGQAAASSFTVTCNKSYGINIADAHYANGNTNLVGNVSGHVLPTDVTLSGSSTVPTGFNTHLQIQYGPLTQPGSAVDTYTASVHLQQSVTPTTTADTYTGALNINVTY